MSIGKNLSVLIVPKTDEEDKKTEPERGDRFLDCANTGVFTD